MDIAGGLRVLQTYEVKAASPRRSPREVAVAPPVCPTRGSFRVRSVTNASETG